MAEIPLTQGFVALLDDADLERVLAAGKWCVSVKKNTQYAVRAALKPDGRRTTIRMHNYITGWDFVDHINGNGLDNRRVNLRPATYLSNAHNVGRRAHNTSGYKGVTWHARARKWRAQLVCDGEHIHLGFYADPLDAARAYDLAALHYFGEFAWTNFPTPRKDIA